MGKIIKNNSIMHGVSITLISSILIGGFMWYNSMTSDMKLIKYKVDTNIHNLQVINNKMDMIIEKIDTKNKGINTRLDKLNDMNVAQYQELNGKIDSLKFQMFKFKFILNKYGIPVAVAAK